jgi:hypothetical protein
MAPVRRDLAMAALALLATAAPLRATAQSSGSVTANFAAPTEGVVTRAWNSINAWSYDGFTAPAPTGAQHPFLTYALLMTATGGCYAAYPACAGTNLDLLVDTSDPASAYAFEPLLSALGNVTASGLVPFIVTGNVPVAYSVTPVIGAFGVNKSPPDRVGWSAYSAYIAALAAAVVGRFGGAAVSTWKWGVLTEYNNPDWFDSPTAQTDYLALYDWTACGLRSGVGPGVTLNLGAHACTQCTNGWDPRALVAHAANGSNACSGGSGTQLNWLSDSFYETRPGVPGDLSWFAPQVGSLRQAAVKAGFGNITFGIDEGRVLSGPEGLPLLSRAVGATWQGSWDALLFKLMSTAAFPTTPGGA